MTSEQRIEKIMELSAHPPRVERHGWDLFWYRVFQFCSVLTIAALVIALIGLVRIAGVAFCINTNLSGRNPVATSDSQAHIDFAKALDVAAFHPKPGETQAQRRQTFKTALTTYENTLTANQAFRATHPLGKC